MLCVGEGGSCAYECYLCICVSCVGGRESCAHECSAHGRPEYGVGSPGAGVTDNSVLSDMDVGN